MIEFAIYWFGIGAFVALMNFVQWCLEDCLVGEGPEDRFYYLSSMLQRVFFGFAFGPIILFIQLSTGMSIFPWRRH